MATYKFGVRKAYIAPWTSDGVYGTLVKLDAINQVQITEQTTSARLEGDDRIAATHAIPISARVALRFGLGPNTMEVMKTISGRTLDDYTTYKRIKFGGTGYPFFGFVAQVYETGGTGDNILRIPYMKAMDGISFSAVYGGFVINNPNFEAIAVENHDDVWWLDENVTALTVLSSIL